MNLVWLDSLTENLTTSFVQILKETNKFSKVANKNYKVDNYFSVLPSVANNVQTNFLNQWELKNGFNSQYSNNFYGITELW